MLDPKPFLDAAEIVRGKTVQDAIALVGLFYDRAHVKEEERMDAKAEVQSPSTLMTLGFLNGTPYDPREFAEAVVLSALFAPAPTVETRAVLDHLRPHITQRFGMAVYISAVEIGQCYSSRGIRLENVGPIMKIGMLKAIFEDCDFLCNALKPDGGPYEREQPPTKLYKDCRRVAKACRGVLPAMDEVVSRQLREIKGRVQAPYEDSAPAV